MYDVKYVCCKSDNISGIFPFSADFLYRYNTQWYIAPLKTQKLLLFVMQKSMRHSTIILGGLFVPSLEGFATVERFS
jgi:hypothetical protein